MNFLQSGRVFSGTVTYYFVDINFDAKYSIHKKNSSDIITYITVMTYIST